MRLNALSLCGDDDVGELLRGEEPRKEAKEVALRKDSDTKLYTLHIC
jgi:hypothetical protein